MADTSFVEVTGEAINVASVSDRVKDRGAGALCTFTGVTRDNFANKEVLKLEYEAYKPMAELKLQELCRTAHSKWKLLKIAIAHRTGVVLVGEPSVIIAVSSAHRREALEACSWAIDELKATVPIWKKEYFADGDIWKENSESRFTGSTAAS